MACTIEQTLDVSRLVDGCATTGGLSSTAYIFNAADITAVTRDATSKVVQTITLAASAVGYKWVGKKNSWGFTSNKPADDPSWTQTISLVFNVGTALEMFNFEKLAAAAELVIIIQDNNESFKIFGLGLDSAGAISTQSGLDQAEGNVDIPVETTGDTTARLNRIGKINNTYLYFSPVGGTVAAAKTYLENLLT